ncbi:MAG: serine hydrolase domain-containing protein [Saprospiraceae bacterium]
MKHYLAPFYCTIALLALGSIKGLSQTISSQEVDLDFIDYLFKDYDGQRPSASVMVIKDGEIAFAKSYGYADLANKVLATPKTNYRIASVSKQFTAMAIMLLVDQGLVSYETPISDIFPSFPAYGKDITLQHLLTHRSGLVSYNRFIEEGQTEQLLDKDVLAGLLKTDSTYFEPGSTYKYSNTGYAVLAQAVERLSGLSFADFMAKEIFSPLGMSASRILEIGEPIAHRAYGYIVKDTSVTAKDQSLSSAIQGDGGVYTSLFDYYKWDQALDTDSLLPHSSLNEAFFSYDENGKSADKGYGYGWKVSYDKGVKLLQHGGSSTGFGSYVIRIPSEKLSIVLFTNRNKRGSDLQHRAMALASHFSKGKFQTPFELVLAKEIDQNGIDSGISLYERIKSDTASYSVTKESMFYFGLNYINDIQNMEALGILSCLAQDHPKYFGGYYGRGIVYARMKDKENAISNFQKTIEFAKENQSWAVDRAREMIDNLSK